MTTRRFAEPRAPGRRTITIVVASAVFGLGVLATGAWTFAKVRVGMAIASGQVTPVDPALEDLHVITSWTNLVPKLGLLLIGWLLLRRSRWAALVTLITLVCSVLGSATQALHSYRLHTAIVAQGGGVSDAVALGLARSAFGLLLGLSVYVFILLFLRTKASRAEWADVAQRKR